MLDNQENMTQTVILFYKYISIDDPENLMKAQREICEELELTGRLIIAEEGINGTLEGAVENIEKYISFMQDDKRFADVDFKASAGTGNSFPKLKIKVRDEIVASRLNGNIDPTKETATHIDPEELHEWFERKEEFTVVDMRNHYEFVSGRFENSVEPGMGVFRELPKRLENIKHLKSEKVVTVCTGGIRCEKASAYLKEQGFKDVYQLKGGIHRYMEKFPDGYYRGGLYVFDGRVVVNPVPEKEHEVVGKCSFCESETEQYVDDDSQTPSRQILCCDKCFAQKDHLRLAQTAHV